ncbi:related to transporter protein HOL1 [Saccharomycodes ludwigii]|uniref:Related to transporter protein HOL1 n=1 Tax=Saccharomycodes ludwigii TaxID=36035 RepID=A0A376B2D5_9ASCO|nr:hypothetical protein SCDLUD_003733 [Saccharomycodes ludwigii]KAH3900728.1 hypothetical protein SCDLUD_003733 [Saccharomycodes ludwigii]SSD58833.1 related to transporter protein HOL1 [Saccharomycodes ludwigii]
MGSGPIDYEAVPGNSFLVDLQQNTGEGEQKKIVLIPTPSDDPNDPLNWDPLRKWTAVLCVLVYTAGLGGSSAAVYSVLEEISDKTGITLDQLNNGTGYMFLFFGIGCFIFQPLALQYGKRPVYLFSMLSTALICVWPPYTKSDGEWIGSKILQGLLGACVESLPEISMSDLFFEHERGTALGMYALVLLTSSYLSPLIAGFIASNQGWEWVMFWTAIVCAIFFVFLLVFMEETNYERKLKIDSRTGLPITFKRPGEEETDYVTNVFSKTSNIQINEQKQQAMDDVLNDETSSSSNEKDRKAPKVDVNEIHNLEAITSADNENVYNQVSNVEYVKSDEPTNYKIKTYWERMSLTSGIKKKFLLHHYFLGPFYMARFPVILWAGFLYGSSLVWFNVLNATEALILGGDPYNFKTSMCGLAYISPTIFSVIIFFIVGYISDKLKIYIASKRGGLSMPEDRLWIVSFYAVFGCAACILWGVGAYYEVHWFGLVFGLGLLGGLGVFGCASSTGYVVDSYHELDTEAMVVVIIIRNCMSFGVSYGITDWVVNLGYKNCFISVAFICFACNASFLLMIYTGPWWRNRQKHAYWNLVEKYRNLGMH